MIDILNINTIQVLSVNMLVALVIMLSVRIILGLIFGVSVSHELSIKDNFAFGISFSSIVLSVMMIVLVAISGEVATDIKTEIGLIFIYGGLGIFIMLITRLIFDKITLNKINIKDEILNGNISVSIVDSGNIISSSIIIYNLLNNKVLDSYDSMLTILVYFLFCQLSFYLCFFIRRILFYLKSKTSLTKSLLEDNKAVAIRFLGYNIATAIIITTVLYFCIVEKMPIELLLLLFTLLLLLLYLFTNLINKVILFGIDIREEIDIQDNFAIGLVEAVVVISVSLIMMGILIL